MRSSFHKWHSLLAAFAAFTTFLLLSHPAGAYTESNKRPLDPAPMTVEVGEHVYDIPRNYLIRVTTVKGRRDLPAYFDRWAYLKALWPGLEPLTRANGALWDRRRPMRQIWMFILKREVEGSQQMQNVLRAYRHIDPQPGPGPFGLQKYYFDRIQFFVPTDKSFRAPLGTPLVISCPDVLEAVRERFDVELLCFVTYRLTGGAWLRYKYFISNLENWREIDKSVRALVMSFQR